MKSKLKDEETAGRRIVEMKSLIRHLQYEMPIRHPSRDVKRVIVYRHLEFRGEV